MYCCRDSVHEHASSVSGSPVAALWNSLDCIRQFPASNSPSRLHSAVTCAFVLVVVTCSTACWSTKIWYMAVLAMYPLAFDRMPCMESLLWQLCWVTSASWQTVNCYITFISKRVRALFTVECSNSFIHIAEAGRWDGRGSLSSPRNTSLWGGKQNSCLSLNPSASPDISIFSGCLNPEMLNVVFGIETELVPVVSGPWRTTIGCD